MKASELQPGQFPQGTEARVCEDIAERQSLGVSKYGTTVERNPLCLLEWLEHAYQECLDQAVYLKRAMEELQTGKNVTGWDDEPKQDGTFKLKDGAEVGFDGHKFALLAHMQGKTDCKTFDNKWDAEKFAVDLLIRKDSRVFMCEECWMCCGVECDSPGEVLAEWQANLNAGEFFNVVEVPHNAKFVETPPVAKPEPEQFAVGDWVVCVDDAEIGGHVGDPVRLGVVYQVTAFDGDYFTLDGIGGIWLAERFRRATPAEIAKATEPKPTEQFAAGDWLYCTESHAGIVKGKVYKVLAVKRDGWPEVEEGQGYWNPKYFRRATADEIAANKPDADGWIEHDGNGCPVAKGTKVQVRRYRHRGFTETFESGGDGIDWRFDKLRPASGDIIAYRLVNPPTLELTWTFEVGSKPIHGAVW